MQTQPSAQGIASLYMGNPGALQQRIQKDQQAKPGLPPDLKELMALNIVTNEGDAVKRQQAMDALNQMAPAGQEPPTVAQSIQEQAKQKMQAQMLQQQRQQQGLQALAQQAPSMGVPEGVPQPEAQPQGIDELPVDMEFAGGGIVAFADGGGVAHYQGGGTTAMVERILRKPPVERTAEENALLAQAGYAVQSRPLGPDSGVASANTFLQGIGPQIRNYFTAGASRLSDEELAAQPSVGGAQNERILRGLGISPSPMPTAAPASAPVVDTGDETKRLAARYKAPAAPTKDGGLGGTPEAKAVRQAAGPAAAPKPAAPAPVEAPAKSLADLVADREQMAAKSRDAEMKRYGELVPRPDTSQYDRLIAELEGRKKQFDAPKAGFDAFAEYMGQIAAAGPQRTWAEAGARGAAGQQTLTKERQAQQFDLTKQAIDVAQKKIDIDRAYNKELYTTGEAAAKRTAEIAKETAQEMGLDRRNTATLANQIRVANIGAAATITAAGMRGEGRTTLTPAQRAEIADKAIDNVQNRVKSEIGLQMELRKNPGMLNTLVQRETERLLAAAEGRTMTAAPGAQSPGGNTRMRFDAQGNPIK